jgi:hypothetical protein
LTHALLAGSLAIDTGDAQLATPPIYDQRGDPFVRIVDGDSAGGARIDIGAFEFFPNAALHAVFGDYNHNTFVDAADYTVWRNMSGQTGLLAYSSADGNGDGMITRVDYDVWKSHFGQTVPAAGSGMGAIVVADMQQGEGGQSTAPPNGYAASSGTQIALDAASLLAVSVAGEAPARGGEGEGDHVPALARLGTPIGLQSNAHRTQFVAQRALTPALSRREREWDDRGAALLAWFETRSVARWANGSDSLTAVMKESSDEDGDSFSAACDAVMDDLVATAVLP